ncbi:MAG TPA: C45 family peptidase [Candidatus Bathyarchaeia archaeon]|nr:C45 family peptidase [Candidatus Bathyarchaeia archaeon]
MQTLQLGKQTGPKLIEISGSPYERGCDYGEACREKIGRMIDTFYSLYANDFKLSKDEVLRDSRRYYPYIEDYSPEIAEEIRGIASGSQRTQDELVMLTANYELYEGRFFNAVPHGCTSFAVAGDATSQGQTLVGQSWDDYIGWWWDGESGHVLKIGRDSGPNVMAWTLPGYTGCAGFNSNGLATVWNSLHCEETQIGIPAYTIVREVMQQKTIGDAVGAVERAKKRAESFNLVVGDKNGELYDIEATPSKIDYHYSENMLAHANNFCNLKVADDKMILALPDTVIRCNRMGKLLKSKMGALNRETIQEFYKDHVNYPFSICRHPPEGSAAYVGKTHAAIIVEPGSNEFWVTNGNPCQAPFHRYSLE